MKMDNNTLFAVLAFLALGFLAGFMSMISSGAKKAHEIELKKASCERQHVEDK